MRDGNRVLQAHLLLDSVKTLRTGDYAEVGTYRGNYGRIIYSRMADETHFYCVDTFEGFDAADVAIDASKVGASNTIGHFGDTSIDLVRRNICGASTPDRLVLCKGFFPETFSGLEDRRWSFVMLDADLYAPIKAGLELFWPRMVPGGLILVHDYLSEHYKGSRMAVDEFCGPTGIIPAVWPDRVGTAILAKPHIT
ncbi:class I SAM-dependent methyltransferase [Bradyrhizobium erythrophlei]|uniref:Macrocin-O-methyltransferase (TylF) n=1 Tax=Bradyrhizobium erythrophlei TaxID=1437360 RepID=A0A1M7SPU0_9BRAD|nr:class I SAM-dependent methyltransferase [Bradyrhizobium erythrophlei]SHN60482.1 Macrocin-O-methyltransferase (TylF) [Bradyrhizobium erythrophlei]